MTQTEQETAPVHGVWAAVGCQMVLSVVFAFALYAAQSSLGFGYWALNLAAFGPLLAAGVTLMIGRAVGWPMLCRPGLSFDLRGLRRSFALLCAGAGIAAICVHVYSWLKWPLKHALVEQRPHPLLSRFADPAWLVIWVALGLVVTALASEFGWRAVMQPTMRQRVGVVGTGAFIGVGTALTQVPWLAGMLRRYQVFGQELDLVLYLIFLLVAMIAMSVVVTATLDPMEGGRWVAGAAFAWALHMGMFLINDEEWGRWQGVASMAIGALMLWSAVSAIARHGLPGELVAYRVSDHALEENQAEDADVTKQEPRAATLS